MGDEKLKVSWDDLSRKQTSAPDASGPARPTEKGSGKSIITWDDLSRKQTPAPDTGWSTPAGFDARPAANGRRKSLAIAAAVGGLLIVVVAVTLVLSGGSDRRNIEAVLRTDQSISASLSSEPDSGDLAGMVERMSTIDLSGCPADFQQAYQRYIEAWGNMIEIVQESENLSGADNWLANAVIGFIGGITGNLELPLGKIAQDYRTEEDLNDRYKQLITEIENSYREVLRIAQSYRVDTTPYSGNGKE